MISNRQVAVTGLIYPQIVWSGRLHSGPGESAGISEFCG
jgi:hypothetical protein